LKRLTTTIIFLSLFFIVHADGGFNRPIQPTGNILIQPKVTKNKLKGIAFWLDGCLGDKIELELPSDGYGWFSQSNPILPFYYPINPTDTFVFKMNAIHPTWKYSYGSFQDYNGQSNACPIVITMTPNTQTTFVSGIAVSSCQHIKITGRYSTDNDTNHTASLSDNYGLYVSNPAGDMNGVGVAILGRSRDVFVERVKVYQKTYGFWAKQDPSCDTSMNYMGPWSFRMDSVTIKQCVFLNIGQDVGYDGNTDPTGDRDPIFCDSAFYQFKPMRISNHDICYNYVDSARRTGMQQSGADQGYNQIRYNIVKNMGYEFNQQQGDGIAIGGMTINCHVFGNTIKNTFLYGILNFGCGTNYINDNIIDSSGFIPINLQPYRDTMPTFNMDSLISKIRRETGAGLEYSDTILINTYSRPSNILLSTKKTIPSTTKTDIIKFNVLGENATTGEPHGSILFADFSVYPGDWTQNSVCCGNTSLLGTVTITRFPYNPGTGTVTWPIMEFNCYKQYLKLKKGRVPSPVNL
jgi:hypothetical protein